MPAPASRMPSARGARSRCSSSDARAASAATNVRIELPGNIGKASRMLKMVGMGARVEQLENSMNTAAERPCRRLSNCCFDAVRKMTVRDAKAILAGGDDSATQYLNKSSREQIRAGSCPSSSRLPTGRPGAAVQRGGGQGSGGPERQLRQYRKLCDRTGAERPVHGDRRAGSEHSQEPGRGNTSLAKKVFGAL